MKNKVIVLGNGLYNTLGIIRSLGEQGIPVILILEPGNAHQCFVRRSRYISTLHCLVPGQKMMDVLKLYKHEDYKPILLIAGDPIAREIDAQYDEIKKYFYCFNAGKQGRISHYLEKLNTFPLAEKAGFHVIKTWLVASEKELPADMVYPCLIKGANSTESSKADLMVCADRQELCKRMRPGVRYLLQEYLQKEHEIDIVGLSWKHGEEIFVPAVVRKIRDDLHRQSVYIRLDDIREYRNLDVQAIHRLIKAIGYEGIFSVELMYACGRYYFLEVNLRNDGCSYLYTVGGVNYPYLWVLYNCGELTPKILESTRLRTPLFLMHEDDCYNMLEGKVPFFRWLRECYSAEAHFIFNLHDIKPFFFSMYVHLKQVCKKILRFAGVSIKR